MLKFSEKQQEFLDSFKFDSNIIFSGNTGVGKTSLMKALYSRVPEDMLKYWIDDGQIREYVTSGNFSLRNESEQHDRQKYAATLFPLEMCIRSKILFFDDIGSSENISDSQKTKIKFILDERDKKGLVTIFSTNLNPKEIENLYGERIKSRIYDGTEKAGDKKGLQIVNITGEDRRKKNIKSITL